MKYSLISKYRDELMGIAILNVLVLHFLSWTKFSYPIWVHSVFSYFGSLIFTEGFLFLSGFGLFYSLNKKNNLKSFYIKRFQRLLVPYWIMVFPFFLAWCIFGKFDVGELFLRLTTLQFWFHGNFSGMWYISVSLVLYLMTPLICKVIKSGVGIIILLMITYILLWLLYSFAKDYYNITLIGLTKIQFFFLGMWVGKESFNDKQIYWLWLWLIIALWFISKTFISCSWIYPAQDLYRIMGIIICCLILSMLNSLYFIHSFLKWFGKYTLEIYILHLMFFEVFENIIPNIYIHVAIAIGCAMSLCMPIHNLCTIMLNKHDLLKKIT